MEINDIEHINTIEKMESKTIWLIRLCIVFAYANPIQGLIKNLNNVPKFINTILPVISLWAFLAILAIFLLMQNKLLNQIRIIKQQTTIPIKRLYSNKIVILVIPVTLAVMTYSSDSAIGLIYGVLSLISFEIIMYYRRKHFKKIRES